MKRLFVSAQGLRSGWSLVLFVLIYAPLTLGVQFGFATIPALRDWAAAQPHGVITPVSQIEFTGLELMILLFSIKMVGWIERRSFDYYGLPLTVAGCSRYLKGAAFGLGLASGLLGGMALLGGFSVSGLALTGTAIASNALLYGFGFLLVGLFEEFAFRGYLQATLQRGIGAWTAAVVLSAAFGAMLLPHLREAWTEVFVAAGFGLLGVLTLRRTGDLRFIIAAHAALDWGIAFLYSAPLAGQPVEVHLLNSTLTGPAWLTGGSAGPVGSMVMLPVLALAAVAFHCWFPSADRVPAAREPQPTLCG